MRCSAILPVVLTGILLLTGCGAVVPATATPPPAVAASPTAPPAATATAPAPTATSSPTPSPVPPTATRTPTPTRIPPTATPIPPTPRPATATPVGRAIAPTAVPPKPAPAQATATPRPALPAPPANPPSAPGPEIVRGNPNLPAVALTFDAGAGAAPTNDILTALRERGVRLTFFLTGKWVTENPELARRIRAEGHEIANHSFNHPDFTTLTHEQMVEEINSAERTFQRIIGVSGRPWFRFPYGSRNAGTRGVVTDLGYTSVMWTLDSLDSVGPPKTPQQIYDRVVNNAANGSIILVHIGSAPTAAALPGILDALTAKGFRIVTMSQLMG